MAGASRSEVFIRRAVGGAVKVLYPSFFCFPRLRADVGIDDLLDGRYLGGTD